MWIRTRRDIFNIDDVLRFHCYDWNDRHETITLTLRDSDNQISVDREEGERILAYFNQRKGIIRPIEDVIDDTFVQNHNPFRETTPEEPDEDDQPQVNMQANFPTPYTEIDMTQVRPVGTRITELPAGAPLNPFDQFVADLGARPAHLTGNARE